MRSVVLDPHTWLGAPSPATKGSIGPLDLRPARLEAVWAQHARIVEQLQERFSDAASLLAEAGSDVLAFATFPREHWRQIWGNNPQERLNREVRRRTDVVGIFPDRAAIVRLVGAVLAEQHDEWLVARRYLSAESLKVAQMAATEEKEVVPELAAAS
jgi:putative transposase